MRKDKYCHNCHKLNRQESKCDKYNIAINYENKLFVKCDFCLELTGVKKDKK